MDEKTVLDIQTRCASQTALLCSVRVTVARANEIWPALNMQMPSVHFDVRGHTLHGYATYCTETLGFNNYFLALMPVDMIENTAPHEVAHLVAYKLYGKEGQGHGRLWQQVMRKLGLEPVRCASAIAHTEALKENPALQPVHSHIYGCGCPGKERLYSNRRHRNVTVRGRSYKCRTCNQLTRKIR